jgi:S-adenosylmethionine:tRNA ribosyltransferase-isomerase
VGAGTFKTVKAAAMQQHEMHAEWLDISKNAIQSLLNNLDNNIVAVGTTSLRTIESIYWLGVKTKLNPSIDFADLYINQWEAYDLVNENVPVVIALRSLLQWMDKKKQQRFITKTQILIQPGYELKIAKGLITNFHQPQSTLLLLVAAFIGAAWKDVYEYALHSNFRFLSYGDSSLLWYNKPVNVF